MDSYLPEDFLAQYQTIIVGLLGFIGVIVTLLANAYWARKQHSREVDNERQVVRVALREELKIVAESCRRNIESLAEALNHAGHGAHIPTTLITDIYDTVLPRLGLLTPGEVSSVMFAYLSYKTAVTKLKLLPHEPVAEGEHLNFSHDSLQIIMQLNEELLPNFENAINALDV